MTRRAVFVVPTALVVLLGVVAPGASYAQDAEVEAFLRDRAGFNDKDLEKLERGEAVARIVKTEDNREVMVIGAVRVDVPVDFIAERFSRVEGVASHFETVSAIGRFGSVPSAAEASGMALPRDDISGLEKCRPEDCDVKMPADAIEVMHRTIDWDADDAASQANRFFRDAMVAYLTRYLSAGDAALATYDDKKEPLSVAEGFDILFAGMTRLHALEPRLHAHAAGYPAGRSEDIEDVFYWMLADFGLKPVLSLKHLSIQRNTESTLGDAMVVIKEIYSSHYFQAAVEVVSLKEVAAGDGTVGTMVIYAGRSRFDGKVGGLKRGVLNDKVRDNERAELRDGKAHAEREYAAARK